MGSPTIGVDLGGTNIRAAVVDSDGAVILEQRSPTPRAWPEVVLVIAEVVAELRREHPAVDRLGVGAAGMIDRDGVNWYAPNVPAFVRAPLRAAVAEATGLTTCVDNDANVAALGELVHGAARGVRDALLITLGTGIGGGLILNGEVYRGANGFAAELGHFQVDPRGPMCACGQRGHWEAYASGNALGRMGREQAIARAAPGILERVGGDTAAITGVLVGDAAHDGDPAALGIVREYADYVAIGLAGLANILDPERIVISGGLVALGELLFVPIRQSFSRRVEAPDERPPIAVVPAELGDLAGVVGAAVLARPR